jgi:hypothetical protein
MHNTNTTIWIVIIVVILLVIFFCYNKTENFGTNTEAVENIASMYANSSGTANFNNINAGGTAAFNNITATGNLNIAGSITLGSGGNQWILNPQVTPQGNNLIIMPMVNGIPDSGKQFSLFHDSPLIYTNNTLQLDNLSVAGETVYGSGTNRWKLLTLNNNNPALSFMPIMGNGNLDTGKQFSLLHDSPGVYTPYKLA